MTSDGYVWTVMCGGVRSITGGLHKAAPPYVRCHPMCAEASWTSTGRSMGRADNDVCPATPRKSWENLEKITRKHDEPDDPTPSLTSQGLQRRQVVFQASGRRVSGWFEKIFYISDPAITVNRWPKRYRRLHRDPKQTPSVDDSVPHRFHRNRSDHWKINGCRHINKPRCPVHPRIVDLHDHSHS